MIGENSIQSRELMWYGELPIKVYLFSYDFERLYGTTERALEEVESVIENNPGMVRNAITGKPYLYAISFPWGYI